MHIAVFTLCGVRDDEKGGAFKEDHFVCFAYACERVETSFKGFHVRTMGEREEGNV